MVGPEDQEEQDADDGATIYFKSRLARVVINEDEPVNLRVLCICTDEVELNTPCESAITLAELRGKLESGETTEAAHVWTEEFDNWTEIHNC